MHNKLFLLFLASSFVITATPQSLIKKSLLTAEEQKQLEYLKRYQKCKKLLEFQFDNENNNKQISEFTSLIRREIAEHSCNSTEFSFLRNAVLAIQTGHSTEKTLKRYEKFLREDIGISKKELESFTHGN